MCIKLKREFLTGSDKNVTGHVTYIEMSLYWSSPHILSCSEHHITASQYKSNMVSIITTANLVNAMFV